MFSFSINTCVHYNVQQIPSQQPTALMPTPTMQTQITTPQMGGVGVGRAHSQYAPPPNMVPGGASGGYPHQQPGVPMSAPSSNLMSVPATSAPPPSMYAGVVGHAPNSRYYKDNSSCCSEWRHQWCSHGNDNGRGQCWGCGHISAALLQWYIQL